MSKKQICLGDLKHGISIVQRSLLTPVPGSAAPHYDYVTLMNVRAAIKTRGLGSNSLTRVEIGDQKVSHEFTIRYSKSAFEDDAKVNYAGRYFDILGIENIDEQNKYLKISCSEVGSDQVEAVQ